VEITPHSSSKDENLGIAGARFLAHQMPLLSLIQQCQYNVSSLTLHFNGHFPGEPGLAGVYWSKGWWRWC